MPKVFYLVLLIPFFFAACGFSTADDDSTAWNIEDEDVQDFEDVEDAQDAQDVEDVEDVQDVQETQLECPDGSIPADNPDDCGTIEAGCGESQDEPWLYDPECGCYCEEPPVSEPECPDETIPADNPADCGTIFVGCGESQNEPWLYDPECGCYCEETPVGSCEPMDANGDGLCDAFFGWAYHGGEAGQDGCVGVSGCECHGDDCDDLFVTLDECLAKSEFCGG